MAKPAGRFESCCGGLCGASAQNVCHAAVSKPIETAFGANREAPWQSKRDASKATEGCAVVRS